MGSTRMKRTPSVLSRGEREILIMAAIHPGGRHLSFSEIGQRRSMSVNSVRMAMHRVCVKLDARNRYEAILVAVRRGELNPDEYLSPDELVQIVSTLGPNVLKRLAHGVRQDSGYGYIPQNDELNVATRNSHGSILTRRERDVLILVARGLPNSDIAKQLYISVAAVRVFLTRAYAKLGACNRGDAVVSALKQGDISLSEMYTLDELVQMWAPLGADIIENMAQLLKSEINEPTMN